MSNDIFESKKLQVTAFAGDEELGYNAVQISLKGNASYEELSAEQCLELAHALISRNLCKEGYRATD